MRRSAARPILRPSPKPSPPPPPQKDPNPNPSPKLSNILPKTHSFAALSNAASSSSNPQPVLSILQNQPTPLHSLKLYLWLSRHRPHLSNNRSVRSVLSDLLRRKGPLLLSPDLLHDLRRHNLPLTEDALCLLLSSWGRLGLSRYANHVFAQMPHLGLPRPTTRLYNSLIDALVRSGSLDLAYLKFHQMSSDSCPPDRLTYNALIHGVCTSGIMDEAARLAAQMDSLGHPPNVFTYTMLVHGFCNAGDPDAAARVLDTMRDRNVQPTTATFRSLVHGAFRCLEPRAAYRFLLRRVLEWEPAARDDASSVVLHCLSKRCMGGEARDFIGRMARKGYLPDASTFGLAVACVAKSSGLGDACEVFDDFVRRGGKPGFGAYRSIVISLLEEGEVSLADRYVEDAVSAGLVCSVESYNTLIDCFVKAGFMGKAMGILEEMDRKKVVSPNLVTFNTLIAGHSKAGDVRLARDVLKMLLARGCKPDIVTFSCLIDGLCRVHQMDDAFGCFNEMVEWGVSPNAVTYNILIRSLCALGDVRKSMKLFVRMKGEGINPDVFSFNALIISLCKIDKIERARNLFDSMLRFGVTPDTYTYNAFIRALCDARKFKEAREAIVIMETNGCSPNSYTYGLIIDALSSAGHLEDAEEVGRECENRGIHIKNISNLKTDPEIADRVVNS